MHRTATRHPIADFCDAYGLLLRRDAVELGISDTVLGQLVRSQALVRLRQGCYCLASTFRAGDGAERHRLLCRAVLKLYADHVALSHASSCLIQGGPDFGLDLSSAHLTHFSGGGRRASRIVHHLGECRVGDLRRSHGLWVTTPARAVVEVACIAGVEAALVQANHFLHQKEMSAEELATQAASAERWPGSIRLHPVLTLADERIESVGESRSYLMFFNTGLPRPIPQFEVRHLDGSLAATVDFAWPELRVIVEFDGRTKYHRLRRPGETIEQVVEKEKLREDLIRELTGWTVIRLTWKDLDFPAHTANRIRQAARRPVA